LPLISEREKTKMPDRALRLTTHRRIRSGLEREKTKMPDRALRPIAPVAVALDNPPYPRENKNARQGIATPCRIALDVPPVCLERKQKCPTGHCDVFDLLALYQPSPAHGEKTKMPDRALRLHLSVGLRT